MLPTEPTNETGDNMKGTFDFKKIRNSALLGALMSVIIIAVAFYPLISGGEKNGAILFMVCIIPVGLVPALVSFIPYISAKKSTFEADDEKIISNRREYPLREIEGVLTTVSRYGQDLVITFIDEKTKPLTVSCLTNADELSKFISTRLTPFGTTKNSEQLRKKLRIFETAMIVFFAVLVISIVLVLVFLFRKDSVFPDARVISFGACAFIAAIVLFFTARKTLTVSNILSGRKFSLRRERAGSVPIDGNVVKIYADHSYYSRFLIYFDGVAFFSVVQLISDDGEYSEMMRSRPEKDISALEKVIGTEELLLIYDTDRYGDEQ